MTKNNFLFVNVTPSRPKSLMLEESYSLYSVKTPLLYTKSSEVYCKLQRFFLHYFEIKKLKTPWSIQSVSQKCVKLNNFD